MSSIIGQFCVVRTRSAGVHTGYVREFAGTCVVLGEARRVWQWWGAFSLNEMALHGVAEKSKISEPVAVNVLTEAIEVIPCTGNAKANLSRSRHSPNG